LKFIRIFLCFLLLTLVSTLEAQDTKKENLQKRQEQLKKEMKLINALLFSSQKKERSAISQIENLNAKLSIRKNLISVTNDQVNLLTTQINSNQKEITRLRTQLKKLKEDYAQMVVRSYKSKSQQSYLMFLLSSDDFSQAYKRLQYLKQYAEYQKKQAETIKEKSKQLQDLNLSLSAERKGKQKLINENKASKRQLEIERKKRAKLMATIRKDIGVHKRELSKKRKEANRIEKQLNNLIDEVIAEVNKKSGNTKSSKKFVMTPKSRVISTNFKSNRGRLGWPVKRGVIKTRFGTHPSPIDPAVKETTSSIKIATDKNADVLAVFEGEVSKVQLIKNSNIAIMIRHGSYITTYFNLASFEVKQGQKVKAGQKIGTVFTNKRSGESLLTFRINKSSTALNPEKWLSKQ